MKSTNNLLLFTAATCMFLCFTSCRPITTPCSSADVSCSSCQRAGGTIEEYCYCMPDYSYHCPAGIVHGVYRFDSCSCECEYGWIGPHCDQQDTSLYIGFSYGSDTTALSAGLKSPNFSLRYGYPNTPVIIAFYPAGSGIDSVKFGNFPGRVGTVPLCGGSCAYMEAYFSNGQKAFSISGSMTTDDSGVLGVMRKGTFNADLYVIGTGDIYYVRNGIFNLAF